MPPLFPLGRTLATPGALEALSAAGLDPADLMDRHSVGDWGELGDADRAENKYSLRHDCRLLSSYPLPGDAGTVWIITEADREYTTILLPEEY